MSKSKGLPGQASRCRDISLFKPPIPVVIPASWGCIYPSRLHVEGDAKIIAVNFEWLSGHTVCPATLIGHVRDDNIIYRSG
jgi:hypothetical protein